MSIDRDETTDARCPSCGARNSGDAVWCSLCFGSMQEPARQPAPQAPKEPTPPAAVPGTEQADGGQEPAAQPVPQPRLDAMLAELAAVERPVPRWSGASALVASPGARVAVMLLGTVLVTGVGFALMAVLGALL